MGRDLRDGQRSPGWTEISGIDRDLRDRQRSPGSTEISGIDRDLRDGQRSVNGPRLNQSIQNVSVRSREAEKNDKKLMDFPKKLKNIGGASRLFKQELESEFEKLKVKLQLVKGNIEKQPELREQMEDFIQRAEVVLDEVQRSMTELQTVSRELAEYFCEEEEKFKLEDCCTIFKTFGEKFITATEVYFSQFSPVHIPV
ncbi:FH2 domain-containing protein 1-like [Scyliorhinus canicula]|uniref:FH2 domain-containing protein 1-like n=1 Tax=Scyliorhinus canicula TaxID=7830 RepID=UPI0018F657AE|nr:FH2 domain-containing protein 1-like [Scyliorhinus canicula]